MDNLKTEIENTFGRLPIRNLDFAIEMLKLIQLAEQKNRDYAGGDDVYANFKMAETMNVPAWKGVAIRLSDKWQRFVQFVREENYSVSGESFEDTCDDISNYAQICKLLYRAAIAYPPTDGSLPDEDSKKIRDNYTDNNDMSSDSLIKASAGLLKARIAKEKRDELERKGLLNV